MIGWYTDNELSRRVMESIEGGKIFKSHISTFNTSPADDGIFYGILRGCGTAMRILAHNNHNYFYIDNGYFDALYVDSNKQKSMEGKFRVVKNRMHEIYPHDGAPANPEKILIIPPSSYSANFYDTTPEDWIYAVGKELTAGGKQIKVRHKDSVVPLEQSLDWCDGVVSFNSMVVMKAVEMGKSVADTHGVFRKPYFANYSLQDLRAYYEPKQFTLEEFRSGKCVFI